MQMKPTDIAMMKNILLMMKRSSITLEGSEEVMAYAECIKWLLNFSKAAEVEINTPPPPPVEEPKKRKANQPQ